VGTRNSVHRGLGGKRVEDELRESNKRLELLSETASRLLLTDDPQGLVQSLCEKVVEHLGCHVFFNFLLDDENGCLRLNAFAGIPKEAGKSIERLDCGVAVCGCVARDGSRVVVEDIFNNPDPRTDLVRSYGVQAYACNPLLSHGGKVIGTLSFGSRTKTRFADDELDLMRTIADLVANAMERIRLLDEERGRSEELQRSEERLRLALEAAEAGIWEWNLRTNENIWSEELWRLYGLEPGSCEPSYDAWRQTIHPDDRARAEQAVTDAAMNEAELNIEYRVVDRDGSHRWLMSRGRPVRDGKGRVVRYNGIVMDVTKRKQAEQRERELEAHKRDFYRRTIVAATEGKLVVTEPEQIWEMAGKPVQSWHISGIVDVGAVRDGVIELAKSLGMIECQRNSLVGCAVEAIANACKHAGEATASLHCVNNNAVFVVSDRGAGIGAIALPDIALTKGYTTAGTLGMGYKVMIHFADKVYLATGPEGTTVAVEVSLREPPASPIPRISSATISGWV